MNIASTINDATNTLIQQIREVATPIAVLSLIVLGIVWFFSSDPQSIKKIKTWFFCIAGATVLIWAAEPIVDFFKFIGQNAAGTSGAVTDTFKHLL